MSFEHLFREWSRDPLQGRFIDQQRWQSFRRFREILEELHASKDQIHELEKLGTLIESSETLSFSDAYHKIQALKAQRRSKNRVNAVERDRGKPTSYIRRQFKEYEFELPTDITHGQAKKILNDHRDRIRVDEQIANVEKSLQALGVEISERMDKDVLVRESESGLCPVDNLEIIADCCKKIPALASAIYWPKRFDGAFIEKLMNALESAVMEAEDAVDLIKDRELVLQQGDFRLVGKLPKKQLDILASDVATRALRGAYSEDRDMYDLVQHHLPDVELRDIDD